MRFYSYLVKSDGYFYGAYYYRDTYEDGFVIVDPDGEIIFDQVFEDMEIQNLSMDGQGNIFYHGWFSGDITIEDEVITPQPGENYLVGRLKTDLMISGTTIQDEKAQHTIRIYPNPARERIWFNRPANDEGVLYVTVYDMSGKIVLSEKVRNHSIHIGNLNPGLYLIRLQYKDMFRTEKLFIY